jgi:hypothetical protein
MWGHTQGQLYHMAGQVQGVQSTAQGALALPAGVAPPWALYVQCALVALGVARQGRRISGSRAAGKRLGCLGGKGKVQTNGRHTSEGRGTPRARRALATALPPQLQLGPSCVQSHSLSIETAFLSGRLPVWWVLKNLGPEGAGPRRLRDGYCKQRTGAGRGAALWRTLPCPAAPASPQAAGAGAAPPHPPLAPT